MLWRIPIGVLLSLFSLPARAAEPLETVAKAISEQIAEKPEVAAKLYGPEFLAAVPVEKMAEICKTLFDQHGRIVEVVKQPGATATSGKFTFRSKDAEMTATLQIEKDDPHRIIGLFFGPATPRVKTWDELVAKLKALPGEVSFQLQRLDDGRVLASHQPDTPLGIGSAFKLYILATLADQKVAWDKVVKIDDRLKSLPSGALEHWPAGSPVTVHTLAITMISQSDNTATDHLLALAGREEVEKRLASFGLKSPAADTPFLATREFFRLKVDEKLRNDYLATDIPARRAILKRITELPRLNDEIGDWTGPIATDKIEWFAGAADICRALAWLDKHGGSTAQDIMAVNNGGVLPSDSFSYMGFKGGSEPGVLSLNWLLHTRDGKRYSLSAIWNNPAKNVDVAQLAGIISAAPKLLPAAK